VKKFVKFVTPKIDEYEELLTTNRIWVERRRIGVISAADCRALGVTGPVLRASGVKWDLRKASPTRHMRIRFRYSDCAKWRYL
jgi:NADH-quinone oxidoreductase subunit D